MVCVSFQTVSRNKSASSSTVPDRLRSGFILMKATWHGSGLVLGSATGRSSRISSAMSSGMSRPIVGKRMLNRAAPRNGSRRRWSEALTLYGLGRLATRWRVSPPFAGDNRFGDALGSYREDIIRRYETLAEEQGLTQGAASWFANHRSAIEASGVVPYGQAFSLTLLAEYESSAESVEALGALNRWPGRAGVPVEEYLRLWEESCVQLNASTRLPAFMRELLQKS